MDSLVFRSAAPDDLERIVDLSLAAYPDSRTGVERRRAYASSPLGSLADLVVVERAGEMIAHAFLYRLEAHFGGAPVKVGGVGSVAVAPSARGQGVGTALMRQLHVLADVRGDAVTMLYPFRHGYYARLGYAATSSRKRVVFDPRSVPEAWRRSALARVRSARGPDRPGIEAAFARAAARRSGWLSRSDATWDLLFARERRFVLVAEDADGAVAGYVAFALVQDENHAATLLEVNELVADDGETERALYGALSRMRDQIAEVVIEVDAADPIEQVLVDPDRRRFGTDAVEHELGLIVGGPMVRIEDVPRAIEARGYLADGAFDVVVRGSDDDADELAASIRVEDGRAEVGPARGGGALRTSRIGLAAILYGGLPATRAVALGLADADPRIASRVEAVTSIPSLTPPDAF